MQEKDPKIRSLHEKVLNGFYKEFYFVENDILYRTIIDNGHKFNAAVVPEELTDTVLFLGHNQSGHNGYQRTYAAIKCSYYWKGMRKHMSWFIVELVLHVQNKKYKKHNLNSKYLNQVYNQWNSCVSTSLENSTLPPAKGNRYTLTAVCMLTGFTFCIPIRSKTAEDIMTAWRNHISFPFGVCRKLLTDNGTEFKNQLFDTVAAQLGMERKIYTPPYRPQSNGQIEGFHNFLKVHVCLNTFPETGSGMMSLH